MSEPTLHEKIAEIKAMLEDSTEGDWRTIPSERPMVYTDCSRDYKPGQDVYYGGYMGTGELAGFSKYSKAEIDAELVVALHNAAPALLDEIERLQGEVDRRNERTLHAEQRRDALLHMLQELTPAELHDQEPVAMFDYLRKALKL